MPAAKKPAAKKPAAKKPAAKKPAAKKPAAKKPAASTAKAKVPSARMTLRETMRELEKAGTAQARKTYARHGAAEPMFGVSFATLKTLLKRIGVDHELALGLWGTRNFDARNLATKVADPALLTSAELDLWAVEGGTQMCCGYVAMLAAEGPHAAGKAKQWLAASDGQLRSAGWGLLGQMTIHDLTTPDAFFVERLEYIAKNIHTAPNSERYAMNMAVILIGCRNAALRKAATAAAKRIGLVDVDHGDTSCKTPAAAQYIEKSWAHSTSKGFESPAAHERSREPQRFRC